MLEIKSQAMKRSILLLFLILIPVLGCNDTSAHFKSYKKSILTLEDGEKITIYIAQSHEEQELGLSGIKPDQLADDEGMLFPEEKMQNRMFWMPNTHMDLDIFFLNGDFYVLDIHRNLKHFPKRQPERDIPRSKTVYSQHVLELKSSSPLAKKIKRGMILDISEPKKD
tara:strand:- start:7408 stop:7911 length:504 start_codon:yes stop_codon:yes gene_type:complete